MMLSKIESDLSLLCEKAKTLGADDAVVSPVSAIVVDPRANLKCQVPICPNYRNNLMCPPYVMTASDFQEILLIYKFAILIRGKVTISEEIIEAANKENSIGDLYKNHLHSFKPTWSKLNEFNEIISKVEAAAFNMGYRFAAGFSGGSCKLCDECVVKQSSVICRHPLKARPSMEAVGIDVFKTAEQTGIIDNTSIRDTIIVYGLVLVD